MRVRVPASAANLGPGFDTLAVALSRYVEVSVEPADRLEVLSTGEGRDLPGGRDNLAARVAIAVAGHDRLRIEIHSEVPVGRGLGSSAAIAVAAAAAAGAADPFAWGFEIDGHPENAAASAFGGLVAAANLDGRPVWRRLVLDPELSFVAVVPERELLTADARAVLDAGVRREDAVFNLGRLALLIAGLADRRMLVAGAGDDRLHQPQRALLFPEAPQILDGLRAAGALTSFWSGAGTTLLAVVETGSAAAIAEVGEGLLRAAGLEGEVMTLSADLRGVVPLGGSDR